MGLSQTSVAALEAGLTQIFPNEMDKKSFDGGQSSLTLLVKQIDSNQFAQLYELLLDNNANIHQKRSGGFISIHIS